ncbi:restriction endonuclease subunit S [Acholeplasma sp. OttesenSCG-928-E16]|nr:restriction endonuclease subunit S [Acholeplasma sp. OttesenSCG-928-E16]
MIIQKFWQLANLERGLNSSHEEMLWNVYRILKIKEDCPVIKISDPYQLLDLMKEIDVTFFRGNERLFFEEYLILSEMDAKEVLDYVYFIQKNSNVFGSLIPKSLSKLLLISKKVGAVLVADADKYDSDLYNYVMENSDTQFFFTVKQEIMHNILSLLFKGLNVHFILNDIYEENFTDIKFDYIIAFPIMGVRNLETGGDFISREPSFIATQNLLLHLSSIGQLKIVLPAKIGFGGGDAEILRHFISDNYQVNEIASLPSRLFYPYMSINTYLITIQQGKTEDVSVIKYKLEKDALFEDDNRLVFADELESMNNWNVDMAFSLTDETIMNYKNSLVKKAPLKDVADVFRGKSIAAKTEEGNVLVINISNISEVGIDYNNLDFTVEEERKVQRYLLEQDDVLITTKGFSVKIGVYEDQQKMVIASSNLCVVRPNKRLLTGTYLKLFLESETGMKLLKSLQRGTSIVNINYQDICELEVPIPPLEEQLEITNEYEAGLKLYKETINQAEYAWSKIKANVQRKLF